MASPLRDIAVWEWQEDTGLFVAYEPKISNEIEDAHFHGFFNSPFTVTVEVPGVKRSIRYLIDLNRMEQKNESTGVRRRIRRTVLLSTSALAKGFTWQWQQWKIKSCDKKFWVPYATDLVEELELASSSQHRNFMFPHHYGMPYSIDFVKNMQRNTTTGFERNIRRVALNSSYKFVSQPLSSHTHSTSSYPHSTSSYPQSLSSYPHPTSYINNIPSTSALGTSQPLASSHAPLQSVMPQNSSHQNHTPNPVVSQTGIYPGLGGSMYSQPTYPTHQQVTTPFVMSQSSNYTGVMNTVTPNAYPQSVQTSQMHRSGGYAVPGSSSVASSSPPSMGVLQISSSTPPPVTVPVTSVNPPAGAAQPQGSLVKKWQSRPVPWKPCPQGGISCQSRGATANVPLSQVLSSYTKKVAVDPNATDQCSICQCNLTDESGFGNSNDTVELVLCKHVYHLECVEASYSHGVQNGCIVCPYCNKSHGMKTGDQPPGVMRYSNSAASLPGYPGHGTIRVTYHIPVGTQSSEHPHPGKSFGTPGFPRTAYLPDNDEGRSVLYMLVEAWKRRLTFTVGRSSTTGMDDVVTWAGIHHKTSNNSYGSHGYPDPTYLERVRDELETVGVFDDGK